MLQIINDKIKECLKTKNTIDILVYKDIKNRCMIHEKENNNVNISQADFLDIITKMIKNRNDTIKMAVRGKRIDIFNSENHEIDILKTFLPKQLTESEIKDLLTNYIKDNDIQLSMREIGPFKKYLDVNHKNCYDSKLVVELIKNY